MGGVVHSAMLQTKASSCCEDGPSSKDAKSKEIVEIMFTPFASVFVGEMTVDVNSLASAGVYTYQRQRAALFLFLRSC